ncbi:MAG: phosphotransferase [Rhodospirillales bacterium]|nr:MAG: phosphotransferase [Rhodospirillales bacterium]
MSDAARKTAMGLSCWTGTVDPRPLSGGITNVNFVVEDAGEKFVVRIGGDIPLHQVMRFNELAASRAAHAAGVSPEVVHWEPGALVLRFIEGKTFGAEDVRKKENLWRIVELIRRVHKEVPKYLRGPALVFWVFHVLRDYAATLRDGDSRMAPELPRLMDIAARLESEIGPVDLVYGHNDLLAANFIDDGDRLWLVDWDYAGFNSPLFDLANLASNNEFSHDMEGELLAVYFGRPADDRMRRRYAAMKCASLLREAMWSMVSEIHSQLDFDYVAYTAENLDRFERVHSDFLGM